MDEVCGRVGVFGANGLCGVLLVTILPFSGERAPANCPNGGPRCVARLGVGIGFRTEDDKSEFCDLTGVSGFALLAGRVSSSSPISCSFASVFEAGLSFSLVMSKAVLIGTWTSPAKEAVVLGVKSKTF